MKRCLEKELIKWKNQKECSPLMIRGVRQVGKKRGISVKAGKEVRLKFLRMFLQEKKAPFGIRVSQEKLSYHEKILSVPLYMIGQLPRLVKDF